MSKTAAFEADLLELIFNSTAIAGLAENHTTPVTSLYVSLHTSDPGESGTQSTNETTYGSYARVGLTRSGSSAWTVSTANGQVTPVADIDFASCTGTPGAALTHFGVGTASSGAGYLIYSGTLSPNITMSTGVIPRIKNTSTITED